MQLSVKAAKKEQKVRPKAYTLSHGKLLPGRCPFTDVPQETPQSQFQAAATDPASALRPCLPTSGLQPLHTMRHSAG